jgi:hypothetical protein
LKIKGVEQRRKVLQHVFKTEFGFISIFVNIKVLVLNLKYEKKKRVYYYTIRAKLNRFESK